MLISCVFQDNDEKEWYYGNAEKERIGPISFRQLKTLFEEQKITVKTKVWAQGKKSKQLSWTARFRNKSLSHPVSGLEGWKLPPQVPQLKWTLLAKGNAVLGEREMSSKIISLFLTVCEFYPSR